MKTLTAAILTMVISLSFLPQHKAEAQSKLYDAAKLRKVDQMIEKTSQLDSPEPSSSS